MESKNSRFKRTGLIFFLLAVILISDQLTKIWARESLGGETHTYFYNSLVLEHSENPGAFLGMGDQMDPHTRVWIFTVGVSVFACVALFLLLKKTDMTRASTIAYSLFVAGGIGNVIDRILKGTVTDFLNVGIGSLRTGIFNIADMAIMLGVGILLYESYRLKEAKK